MNLSKEQRAEFSEFAVEVVKDDKRPPIPPAFFDDLDASAHARIMSYLIPCDMGNLACVCKSTRDSLTGAIIFRAEHQELSLDGPTLDRLYWSELRSIGNGEAYGMRPGDRLRLQQLTSAEIAFELRKERAWLKTPLYPLHAEDRGVTQSWRHLPGEPGAPLVLTRRGYTSISWAEGGTAIHRLGAHLRPKRMTLEMMADARHEGPSFCIFAPDHDASGLATGITQAHGFILFRLKHDGCVYAYDRNARPLTEAARPIQGVQEVYPFQPETRGLLFGKEHISAQSPSLFPRKLLDGWKPGRWYRLCIDFDWKKLTAVCEMEYDLAEHPELMVRSRIDDLRLPEQPIAGFCCYWRQGTEDEPSGSVRWRNMRITL